MDDLFAPQEAVDLAIRREAILRFSWDTWGWPGPMAGELCEIDLPVVNTPEGGSLYCYTEQARLIEQQPDGLWLAEIEMPGDWFKNGRRVLLERRWIGPPRRVIRANREAA
jgi:hypothetical protein